MIADCRRQAPIVADRRRQQTRTRSEAVLKTCTSRLPYYLNRQLTRCYIINAQRMHEGYCNHPVCLSVCYRTSTHIRRLCNKIGYSPMHAKGFKSRVFAKTPSFSSCSFLWLRTAERAANIEVATWTSIDDNYRIEC